MSADSDVQNGNPGWSDWRRQYGLASRGSVVPESYFRYCNDVMIAGVSVRFVERFPEPAFAELQREIFAPLEGQSAENAAAVRAERAVTDPTDPALWPPRVRFIAYSDEQLVGWTLGWFRRPDSCYMANSGVRPAYRRRDVYSRLVGTIWSTHTDMALARCGLATRSSTRHSFGQVDGV